MFKNVTAKQARKALVALVAFLVSLVSAGVLPAEVGVWVGAAVSALTVYGVYKVPNDEK